MTLTISRPDDWHLHLRDGAMLAGVLPGELGAFRPRHRHAQSGAAGRHRRRDAAAYRDRIMAALPARSSFHAADDALSHRGDRSRRRRRPASAAARSLPSSSIPPAPRPIRRAACATSTKVEPGAGAHGRDRHAALRPWRGDRPGDRHLRPRGGVHRPRAGRRCAGALPDLRIVMEHVTTRDGVDYVRDRRRQISPRRSPPIT